jgi:hypothetical protein
VGNNNKLSQIEIDHDIDNRRFKPSNFCGLILAPLFVWYIIEFFDKGLISIRTMNIERDGNPLVFWLVVVIVAYSSIYCLNLGLKPLTI